MGLHARWVRDWVVPVGLALGVSGAVVAGVYWASRPTVMPFPEDPDVIRVRASLAGMGIPSRIIPEFTVPPRHVPRLLATFRPAWREAYPNAWDDQPLGELKIALRGGRTVTVRFGFSGKNPLCYTLDGVQCVRGGRRGPYAVDPEGFEDHFLSECTAVESVLRDIHRETLTGDRQPLLERMLEMLEESRGQRPPEVLKTPRG